MECNPREVLEIEEVLPAATSSEHQPCRADGGSKILPPALLIPTALLNLPASALILVVPRGDHHCPTQQMCWVLEQLVGPRPTVGRSLPCQGQGVVIPSLPSVLLIHKFLAREEI